MYLRYILPQKFQSPLKVNRIYSAMASTSTSTFCRDSNSTIMESHFNSSIGLLNVKACGDGVHSVSLQKDGQKNDTLKESAIDEQMRLTLSWLESYFADQKQTRNSDPKLPTFCFPSDESTEFERKVWLTLFEKTKAGETLSYGELAKLIDNPKAARAVGTALKKNPIPLIIPCHRVVRTDRSIGNYGLGGSKVKEFLLQHEQGGRVEL